MGTPGTPGNFTTTRSPTTAGRSSSHPKYASAYANRGNVWRNKGENERAFADYGKASSLTPTTPLRTPNRAVAWKNKREYDKAIADCDRRPSSTPTSPWRTPTAAHPERPARKRQGDRRLRQGAELDPKLSIAYDGRGVAWKGKGENEKAIADFDNAIELSPSCFAVQQPRYRPGSRRE